MKKLLLLPLLILSITVFGQFTDNQLYSRINSQIRLKTYSPTRLASVLDSIVKSKSSLSGISLSEESMFIGNSSGVAEAFTMTGDVTISNVGLALGVTTITPLAIDNSHIDFTAGILLTKLAAITASRVPVSNGDGFLIASSVTATELGYVSGLTSAAQTQLDAKVLKVNSATALTDAASIDLTAIKHTLATSSATRTFTISYTGDDITIEVTLSNTAATYTFPAGSLCVTEGVASGDNTVGLSGVSGDKYIIGIKKIGSVYYVAVKNFGQ